MRLFGGAVVRLAARYLLPPGPRRLRRVRSAVIGIAIGIVPLVVVFQVADGMIQGITARYIEAGTYHLQLAARSVAAEDDTAAMVEWLSAQADVLYAFPERQGLGLIAGDAGASGVTIRAVSPDMWATDSGFRRYVREESGSFALDGDDAVVLGRALARRIGAGVGDTVRLLTVRSSGGRLIPRVTRFEVRALISTGYDELDRLWVLIPYATGLTILPRDSANQIIGVKVRDPFALPNPFVRQANPSSVVTDIRNHVGALWRVSTWYELERGQYLSFVSTQQVLTLVMILIVAVAAVNIASSLYLLVADKAAEIAILRSTGTSSAAIRGVFVLSGAIVGAVGALIGVAAGTLAALSVNEIFAVIEWVINGLARVGAWIRSGQVPDPVTIVNPDYYLDRLPVRIRGMPLVAIALATTGLAAAAALVPAQRAARLRPLEVLRRY